jgi:hypothetical protein
MTNTAANAEQVGNSIPGKLLADRGDSIAASQPQPASKQPVTTCLLLLQTIDAFVPSSNQAEKLASFHLSDAFLAGLDRKVECFLGTIFLHRKTF